MLDEHILKRLRNASPAPVVSGFTAPAGTSVIGHFRACRAPRMRSG